MKILHVEAGKNLYGGALQVAYLLKGLQQHGVSNVLVCPQGSAIADAVGNVIDRVREVPMKGDLDVGFVGRLRRIIREERPQLVHLHSRRGADLWGGVAARLEKVPVIVTRRVDNPEPRWWVKLKYRLYDRVVTISNGIREILIAEGLSPERVECVHSAVDTERYRPGCRSRKLIEVLDIADEAKAVGVVAQLIERKGHRYLIDAMPQVIGEYPNVRFVFFGKGPLESELKAHCDRNAVSGHVVFAGFRDDMDELLPCLDVVAHPADMEGLGVALLQASACAVPLIATPVGGIPEIVRDGVNGYLVAPGASEDIAVRVLELLQDEPWARRLGDAGRALVEREFSIAAMVDGNLAVYRSLLKVRR